jgi:hypothetical protein
MSHTPDLSYVYVIGQYYPGVFVSCQGETEDYENIVWEGGAPLPTKAELDARILSATKENLWEEIKRIRDAKKNHGIKVVLSDGARWFHSDPDSRIQQLGLKDQARDVLAAGGAMDTVMKKLGQDIWWKSLDPGDRVPMTCQLAFDLVEAIGNLDAMLFHVAEQHKAGMEASPDPASYNLDIGWPETFLS